MADFLRKYLKYAVFFVFIPVIFLAGTALFPEKSYGFVSLLCAVLACVPFFASFEKKKTASRTLVIISVMTALSVGGRFIFAPVPFFKPVSAMVIITALYFGGESGFLTGAMTAVISNFYFGQGPWTPFQMFAWGMVGFFAGVLAKHLLKNKILLLSYGFISGFMYSLVMDIWTTLWMDGGFNFLRFLSQAASALPVTAVYAVSNVIFLLLLTKPIGKKLDRIKLKYGLIPENG